MRWCRHGAPNGCIHVIVTSGVERRTRWLPKSPINTAGNTPPSVSVLRVVPTRAATAWGDSVLYAAILAGTIFRIVDVLSVEHSTASTDRLAIVRYAASKGKPGDEFVGSPGSGLGAKKRLAMSLKLAIGALESNIRKLERTAGSPLLILIRKKRLARMQEELASLDRMR